MLTLIWSGRFMVTRPLVFESLTLENIRLALNEDLEWFDNRDNYGFYVDQDKPAVRQCIDLLGEITNQLKLIKNHEINNLNEFLPIVDAINLFHTRKAIPLALLELPWKLT
jgi:hypothetical protein